MVPEAETAARAEAGARSRLARLSAAVGFLRRLVVTTVRICLKHRVTGLAAEAGFFALLSLPPLVLGLVASAGYAGQRIGSDVLTDLRGRIEELASTFLTGDAVGAVILPTFDEVVGGGRPDIVSIGFLLSLWSGSRALNVYVDTVAIMYGLGGYRGIVRTRVLSFGLYVLALLLGAVAIPLVLVGPGLLGQFLRDQFEADPIRSVPMLDVLTTAYWPVVSLLTIGCLALLYHLATPLRTPWGHDLPGAALAVVIWVLASMGLRAVLAASVGSTSIYGPLSAPIVLLIWLYLLAIAVLIGAALNAALADLRGQGRRRRWGKPRLVREPQLAQAPAVQLAGQPEGDPEEQPEGGKADAPVRAAT